MSLPSHPKSDQDLVEDCRAGSQEAAQELFNRYVTRLMGVAKKRIGERLTSRFDPEDVVQSVFRTFFSRLKNDQFEINEDDDLSKLLVRITLHKTLRQIAHHKAARRDPGHEAGAVSSGEILQVMGKEPTPITVLTFMDQLDHFLALLAPEEQQILTLKLQGHSTEEIATQINSYDRKVRRVLERIRAVVQEEEKKYSV